MDDTKRKSMDAILSEGNEFKFVADEDYGGFTARAGTWIVHVEGAKLHVSNMMTYDDVFETVVKSYGGDSYANIEGWIRWCDDHCRIGFIEYTEFRVMCLYDHRPASFVMTEPDEDGFSEPDTQIGGNFGYAFNLDEPGFSEWETIHAFPMAGEDVEGMAKRQNEQFEAALEIFGQEGYVFVIDASLPVKEQLG